MKMVWSSPYARQKVSTEEFTRTDFMIDASSAETVVLSTYFESVALKVIPNAVLKDMEIP